MVGLGIIIYSSGSCIVDPTNHLQQMVNSRGNSSKKNRKDKRHQIEFLGGNSSASMVGSSSSTAEWSGSSFGVQGARAT